MINIIEAIDKFLSKVLGFSNQEIILDSIKKSGNGILLIKSTDSFKRHIYSEEIDIFLSANFEKMSEATKKKLGISMGKILAKDLVISFEPISIQKEKIL